MICFDLFSCSRVKTIEQSALQNLQERIFVHKRKLMDTFAKCDCKNTGNAVSLSTHRHGENRASTRSRWQNGPACFCVRLEGGRA